LKSSSNCHSRSNERWRADADSGFLLNLLELQIRQFRNLQSLDWMPSPGINLIVGENGQGKTNLLEAIYFGVLGRSFRTRREEQCLPWNGESGGEVEPAAVIRANLRGRHSTRQLQVTLSRGGKKAWSDGMLVPRLGDLWQGSAVILFSPADVDLFRTTPSGRRGFLDQLLSLGSPVYFAHLQRYQRALKQVNTALKPHARADFPLAAAEGFYRVLAESGGALIELRRRSIRELNALCETAYRTLDGSGVLELHYDPNLKPDPAADNDSVESLADALYERWTRRHEESRRAGMLESGPHRDDLRASLDGHDLGKFGSQGQHRLVVLSLKLSAADWLAEGLDDAPLLLLDDFGSELDRRRREAVIHHLRGRMQTFITATGVEALGEASVFDEVRALNAGAWASPTT
jgi:DNA replication and repair protein RecF